MASSCPRCGCRDLRHSRLRGPSEQIIARVTPFAPRRCTACGWRGWRWRFGPLWTTAAPGQPTAVAGASGHRRRRPFRIRTARQRATFLALLAIVVGLGVSATVTRCAEVEVVAE